MQKIQHNKGYILLMSILVVSIILAISFGIYALGLKEVMLASYLKSSASAFGAADKGIECALYWDRGAPQNGMPYTIFPTSTVYIAPWSADPITYPQSKVLCDASQFVTTWAAPIITTSPDTGTTNFSLTFPDNTCADITVFKESNGTTTVISNGYNSCDPNSGRRTQRTIQVQGNF